jgi:hypothetical protein
MSRERAQSRGSDAAAAAAAATAVLLAGCCHQWIWDHLQQQQLDVEGEGAVKGQ